MYNTRYSDLFQAGVLNPLVSAYLKGETSLLPFYSFTPDVSGFESALKQANYNDLDRNLLSSILHEQALKVSNTASPVLKNIELLKHNQTFTVTTGHQLCLFTGPLYFVYKILSCINLAESLKQKFPDYNFVPVYWMAGEDHDFEEVNHFRLFGKTLRWETSQSGSVGEFNTSDLKAVYHQLREILGNSLKANAITDLFKRAYLDHDNLIDASRYLVNELFGEYGLLCIDGNDARFKHQFKDVLNEDVFSNSSADHVERSMSQLRALGYSSQVNPRKINCFYTEKGVRARIEKESDSFQIVGTSLKLSGQELRQKVEHSPQSFSPNVVLRPLYQQRLLPNLAYVGGPGELAYWLQYKSMFDHYRVFYPVLMPRNIVSIVEKQVLDKLHKLNFKIEDSFLPEQQLVKAIVDRFELKPDLSVEHQNLTQVYDRVLRQVSKVDKTLESSVKAELQKAITGFRNLEAKMLRAIKQKSETEINQVKFIRQKLFPEGQAQERVENFASYYLKHGMEWVGVLKTTLQPFDYRHILLLEDEVL